MSSYTLNDRWQENRKVWNNYWAKFTIQTVSTLLIVIAIAIFTLGYINQHGSTFNWTNIFGDFYSNISSELLSVVLTVLILERLNSHRQDKQELTRLIALLGSNELTLSKIAITELKAHNWLEDGSLIGSQLSGANLKDAYLNRSNLEKTNMAVANLQNANLAYSNLKEALLMGINLQDAKLMNCDFQLANLASSNLENAIIIGANLRGANLSNANLSGTILNGSDLRGAVLTDAELKDTSWIGNRDFSEPTILPDGTMWSENVDIERFTNKNHPEYKKTEARITIIRKELISLSKF